MMDFLKKYRTHIKFLLFVFVSCLFLSLAGVQVIHGTSSHPLDWQLQIGKAITFPLFLIIKGTLAILVGFWLATRTVSFCEGNIQHFKHLTPASQSILINIIQILIYFIFFVAILDVLNLQSSSITFISGAAAFGIGLGLRQIASNLVSGFVLLLERSINVGDFVEIKERGLGFVRRIGTLYSHIEITDGKEIFIPNAEIFNFVSANWTLNHRQARIEFEIVIDYNTPIATVQDICYKIMNAHPCKSQHHEPGFFVDRFNDFGLVLKLHFWLDDIFLGRNRVKSELLFDICTELQKQKIYIPTYTFCTSTRP